MTDIRRTVLWVVFSASLFLIWNAWNVHNGEPSFLSPRPAPTVSSAPASNGSTSAASPQSALGGIAAIPSAPSPAATGEKITITTDLVRATLDTKGGDLVRLELLHQREQAPQAWYAPFLVLFG